MGHQKGRVSTKWLFISPLFWGALATEIHFFLLSLTYIYPLAFGELDYLFFFFSNHMQLISCGSPNLLGNSETWALLVLIISNEIVFRISFIDNSSLVIFKWFFFILQQCPPEKAANSFLPRFIYRGLMCLCFQRGQLQPWEYCQCSHSFPSCAVRFLVTVSQTL